MAQSRPFRGTGCWVFTISCATFKLLYQMETTQAAEEHAIDVDEFLTLRGGWAAERLKSVEIIGARCRWMTSRWRTKRAGNDRKVARQAS